MSHWIILPILLPAFAAALLVVSGRRDQTLSRVLSLGSCFLLLAISIGLLVAAASGTTLTYALGNWPAPFGIVLVLDRLSALMLVLTAFLALMVLLFAVSGSDAKGRHFHALYQFQLMGINGAFLTGDFFNLFVFFEILLIASYGLMVHGGGAERVRVGLRYVVVNILGSTLFLVAVGMIYSVTGTLNMADLALQVPNVAPSNQGLLHAGALLLLLVFAVKAALVPVHFWLPETYSNAPAPVSALFAIMTKVGAYCIIRLYILAFGAEAGISAWLAAPWLLPAALVTLVLGAIGVLAARSLGQIAGFAVISSIGTLLTSVALFHPTALAAALYYLIHSTLAGAALFLIGGLVAARRPGQGGTFTVGPPFQQIGLLAVFFFMAAIAITGMPPLSGFVGKLLILDAARHDSAAIWIWGVMLSTSLVAIIGFMRAGSTLFWKSSRIPGTWDIGPLPDTLARVAVGTMLSALVLLSLFAGPVTRYLNATANQVFDTTNYINAVMTPESDREAKEAE